MEGVEVVPEGDKVADDVARVSVVELLDPEHAGRALQKVFVACVEEELSQLPCAPPPRKSPDAQPVLHDDTGRIAPLWHGGRALVRWAVEMHGGGARVGVGGLAARLRGEKGWGEKRVRL